jgi:protein translocase SecG subunit
MNKALVIIETVSGVLMIATILIQQKGMGMSGIFGGDSGGAYQTKRGFDKIVYYATIGLAVVFFGSAVLSLVY